MGLLTLFVSKITFTSVRIMFPAYPTMAHWYDRMILCMKGRSRENDMQIWMLHTLCLVDRQCVVHDASQVVPLHAWMVYKFFCMALFVI